MNVNDEQRVEALGHRPRVIPVLLLKDRLLYKTVKFSNPKYVGDPRVAVKIFNDKGVDELVLLDIGASRSGKEPDYEVLEEVAGESFVPLAYGGGLRTVQDIERVVRCGYEKIVIGTAAAERMDFVAEAAQFLGSSSVMVCIDAAKDMFGRYRVRKLAGKIRTGHEPAEYARRAVAAGAGELIIQSIARDGTFSGYDLDLVKSVACAVDVPVVALGGAKTVADLAAVVHRSGAAAAAAGSMFVFQLPHRAVLVTFPEERELQQALRPRREF